MTVDFTLKLASAAARVLAPEGGTVLIGKDTRVSGYMFESALEAGFVAAGANVLLAGPLPTPGIAYLCRRLNVDFGVVISASHNPFFDNGIKLFHGSGDKLTNEQEAAIEAMIDEPVTTRESSMLGRAKRLDNASTDYQWFCRTRCPGTPISRASRSSSTAPTAPATRSRRGSWATWAPTSSRWAARRTGAISTMTSARPGRSCCRPRFRASAPTSASPSTATATASSWSMTRANLVDGDQLIHILAVAAKEAGTLQGPVVGTVMSNLGLERSLEDRGIEFLRAPVGDRNVLSMLKQRGGLLGGETSGHVIDLSRTTTGDGLVIALQVLQYSRPEPAPAERAGGGHAQAAADDDQRSRRRRASTSMTATRSGAWWIG